MKIILTQTAVQVDGGLFGPVVLLMAMIGFGIIFLSVLRPHFFPRDNNNDGMMDPSLLEGKGKLTKEEMKLVREAVVRQALQKQEDDNTSVNDLGSIIAQAESGQLNKSQTSAQPEAQTPGQPKPVVTPTEAVRKPVAKLSDIQVSSSEKETEKPSSSVASGISQAPKGGSIDVRTLFEKGLISRAEYDKLSGHFAEDK